MKAKRVILSEVSSPLNMLFRNMKMLALLIDGMLKQIT